MNPAARLRRRIKTEHERAIERAESDYQQLKREFDHLETVQPDNLVALSMVGYDAFRARQRLLEVLNVEPAFREETDWYSFFYTHVCKDTKEDPNVDKSTREFAKTESEPKSEPSELPC
jgi:hypothetical protein